MQRDYGTITRLPLLGPVQLYNCTVVKVLNLLRIYVIQYNVFEQFKYPYDIYVENKQNFLLTSFLNRLNTAKKAQQRQYFNLPQFKKPYKAFGHSDRHQSIQHHSRHKVLCGWLSNIY